MLDSLGIFGKLFHITVSEMKANGTKEICEVAGRQSIWREAWLALRHAAEIYILGYSLPPEDLNARFTIGRLKPPT